MKKLATGISTFSEIIKDNYLYIDKTKDIYDLINDRKNAFLSRPRRFGKSLFISTLEEIFSGNKELFKDLYIYTANYNWEKYPIIKLDFSEIYSTTNEQFEEEIIKVLNNIAKLYNFSLEGNTITLCLKELIVELSKIDKVVILIDEYDDPIINNLEDIKIAKANQKTLRSFYKVIKANGQYIHKFFITGITKVAKSSLFSGANNIKDISLLDEYQTIVGYTQEELEFYFKDYIDQAAKFLGKSTKQLKEDIKFWYNGYNFAKFIRKVYNPYSIANFFDDVMSPSKSPFENYWVESGTPNYLYTVAQSKIKHLVDITNDLIDKKYITVGPEILSSFEPGRIRLDTLLFQSGYLTIADYKASKFDLYYPNNEVKEALEGYLVKALFNEDKNTVFSNINIMRKCLEENDLAKFFEKLQDFIYSISYTTFKGINKEVYYHTIVQEALFFLEVIYKSEDHTNKGRIDLTVETSKYVYIFEIKKSLNANAALKQIEDRQYYNKYLSTEKTIVLVGISFKKVPNITYISKIL